MRTARGTGLKSSRPTDERPPRGLILFCTGLGLFLRPDQFALKPPSGSATSILREDPRGVGAPVPTRRSGRILAPIGTKRS